MSATLLIDGRARDLGGGLTVARVLPFAKRRMVGPFIFFDHMGPLQLAPGFPRELDVRPHPHIGLSTVTYLFSGSITHRDSIGYEQEIRPGEVNWMVAGSGITHSERLEYARAHGANMHGVQAWAALPHEDEETEPVFYHHQGGNDLPEFREDKVHGRLIAGAIDGVSSAVKTHSPLFYLHWEMESGAHRSLGTEYSERAIYVARGKAEISGHVVPQGRMIVLESGKVADIKAREPSTLILLGGEPLGERFIYWNFVSSSKDRLKQARADWAQQRMKLPVGDDQEFMPLPKD